MNTSITETGYGTEQIGVQQIAERFTSKIHMPNSTEATSTSAVSEGRSPEVQGQVQREQSTRNLPRLVGTLLTALRFYAEGDSDLGVKANKAIKLYKGLKYVS
jgi:hypothetical protein